MNPFVMKVVERHEVESVNGPLISVTMVPNGPLCTDEGKLKFFVHSAEDAKAYQVGSLIRLKPELWLPAGK
jgi:hypothetical protein